ncbi:ribonuclease H-like domain-containing protein [Tanacetum coccineum]
MPRTVKKTVSPTASDYTTHPKPTVITVRPRIVNIARSYRTPVNTIRPRIVNTARSYRTLVNNVRPIVVNTARPNRTSVNAARANGFNAGKPQLDDKGFVDSGCSRHMTGNIAYLSNFKQFDGGYVAFGGGAYGGKISSKGTLKTDNLDFEDVYFVNELKFNLFSVSQMCDKKNYVLFTDTECLVLSSNFKLPDKNQILLKIPRKDNMYSFDMKNIVPKESLTCLVAKATLDESMLWHRRLGRTSEILKNFIKEIENLVDKKVKIIRSDNGTEFKNKVMDDFCREKGIKREYSIARTPQQNGVAERRNRTLIEAARTMLADSKLPTTFWAEAISTALLLQNRLLRASFNGKSDEENEPMKEGLDQNGLFDIDSLTQSMNYVPVTAGTVSNVFVGKSEENSQDSIVMPIWKDTSYFDSPTKDVDNWFTDDSSTKDVNAVKQQVNTASPDVNTSSLKLNVIGPSVSTASSNEEDSTEEELVIY